MDHSFGFLLVQQLNLDGVLHEGRIRVGLLGGFELGRDLRRDDDPRNRNAVHLDQVVTDPSRVATQLAENLVVAFVALQFDALSTHPVRDVDAHRVSQRTPDSGERYSGVPVGRLDNGITKVQPTSFKTASNHVKRHSILDASGHVHNFVFGVDAPRTVRTSILNLKQWGAADKRRQRVDMPRLNSRHNRHIRISSALSRITTFGSASPEWHGHAARSAQATD